MEGFKAISLTYKNSPLDIRERVAMDSEESATFLMKLSEVFNVEDVLLVSTCNRTEVYYNTNEDISSDMIGLIASMKGVPSSRIAAHFELFSGFEASKHLFRVALGLESQVLGDIQISNQVKRAYQQSADLNLAGPILHRLMHTIFYANKRVVQETRFQDGTASVASVAADLTEKFVSKIILALCL